LTKRYSLIIPVLISAFSLFFNAIGLNWGLPSEARNRFYPTDPQWYEIPEDQAPLYLTRPWASYHPDEGYILLGLSKMKPGALDFNPHGFLYPSLSIYITGAALKAADILGFVNPESPKLYFLSHPEEIARIYLIGRWIAVIMSSLGVVLLYFCAKELFGMPTGILSALTLAITPLWVRDSHFIVVNVPAASWMVASALLAVIAVRRKSSRSLLASAFVAGLAASTKYPAGMVLLLTVFVFFAGKLGVGNRNRVILFIALPVLALVGFLLGTPYSLLSFDEFRRDLQVQGGLAGLPTLQLFFSQIIVALGWPLLLLALVGLVLALANIRKWEYGFVVLWVAAGLAQRLLSKEDFIRYLITALPPLAICAGLALNALREYVSGLRISYSRAFGYVAAFLLLLPTAAYSLNIDTLMAEGNTQDVAAEWLEANESAPQTVGIFGKLYFDMCPINAEKFTVIDLTTTEQALETPNVLVVSSLSAEAAGAWLTRTQWERPGTQPRVESFDRHPLSIWTWPVTTRPKDWVYTFPEISINMK
jgi:hypothetical protein